MANEDADGRSAMSYSKYFARLVNNVNPKARSEHWQSIEIDGEKFVVDCKSSRIAAE